MKTKIEITKDEYLGLLFPDRKHILDKYGIKGNKWSIEKEGKV